MSVIDNPDNDPEISRSSYRIAASYLMAAAGYVERLGVSGLGKNQYLVASELRQIADFYRARADTRTITELDDIARWEGEGGSPSRALWW